MNIENFDDLLHAARVQPEPQCLLLVFARVDLPENSSESERANFEAGQGGALVPTMSVDLPHARLAALDGFEALRAEGRTTLRPLAEALNDRGMLTRRGGQWHVSSVRNLLRRV